MTLIDLKNYLSLVSPSDDYGIYLRKEYTRGKVINIHYLCTIFPKEVTIFKDENDELILEVDRDELDVYFPWLYKVLNIEYLRSRDRDTPTFEVKVYKVTMKD